MKLLVWNQHIKKPDGTLQAVIYEKATWKLIRADVDEELTMMLVRIEHGHGVTLIPFACVAQIQEQPDDAKAH